MVVLRSKPLLVITLFLAVVLQGLMPFLHAHTGASSQVGIHLHNSSAGVQSAVNLETQKALLSSTSGESPEVGVPASRQNEQLAFDLPDLLVLVFLAFPLASFFVYRNLLGAESVFLFHKLQAQNLPPPALAPPYSL